MKRYDKLVLTALLKKYEKSSHFSGGSSNRRVFLKHGEKNTCFPATDSIDYEAFRADMITLQEQGLIEIQWYIKGTAITSVSLVLEKLGEAYSYCGITGKREAINKVCLLIENSLKTAKKEWIAGYYRRSLEEINTSLKLKNEWSAAYAEILDYVKAIDFIDSLDKPVTMRAMSIRLYSDSKHFERSVKARIVRMAQLNEPVICGLDETEEREILAQLGIITMPEIFEFCGNITFEIGEKALDFSAFTSGACICADSVGLITNAQLSDVKKIIFIENKTNYTEYCLNSRKSDELVIYHGGFYSPMRGRFFEKLSESFSGIPCMFWADIDYGGFKMYARLKNNILPQLMPMNMSADDFKMYKDKGLKRSAEYIERTKLLLDDPEYAQFYDVIRLICDNGATVEQECFL